MRRVVSDRLWIGNALDARNITGVLELGIAAIIDLAIEEPPIQFPRDVIYCRFPLLDGSGNEPAILRAAIEATATFIASRIPTLVACGAGMSRSPAVVAAAIAIAEGTVLSDVLSKLTAGYPHDVSPGLLAEISNLLRFSAEGWT
ncbi:MAG: dual specificity protein phosphatase family protein [Thermoguttaceae bacterium]